MADHKPTDAEVNAAIDELAEKAARHASGTSGHAWGQRMDIKRQADMLKNVLADCHHCDEAMPNGRCWWCGGPNTFHGEVDMSDGPETTFRNGHEFSADGVCVWCRHREQDPDLGCDLKRRILELEGHRNELLTTLKAVWNQAGVMSPELAKQVHASLAKAEET
jgi:hypothetical protein